MEVGRGSKAKFSVSTGETWLLANPLSRLLLRSNSLPLPSPLCVLIVLTAPGGKLSLS